MPTEEQTYRANVIEKLDTIQKQVAYTNGKVRKIIIALVLIAGVLIGQTFTDTHQVISLLAGLIH
jgi:hypothetical protein